jgi:hypothetical protein
MMCSRDVEYHLADRNHAFLAGGLPDHGECPLPTRSYISAVTLVLQCTSGNAVLAQEGQATTAIASANDRGDACTQSGWGVIAFEEPSRSSVVMCCLSLKRGAHE